MRFVAQAVDYEARRQVDILEAGGTIRQETRLFDARNGETRSMRSKEEAHDYRYFPDPDLLPLVLDNAWVREIEASLPELPDDKKARFMRDYGVGAYDAGILVAEREVADYYEALARNVDAKVAANWLNNEILGRLNRDGLSIALCPVSADANNCILKLMSDGTISGKIAKDVLDIVWSEGGDPAEVVRARGLVQMTDTGAIEAAIEEVIAANPDKVEELKKKPKLAGWFVGQVMKQTGGKANPQAVNALLKTRLDIPEEG
jgi:aspartyl-tRNA(Asn)/glutamyl-tRNA(Gln) amidotransferase subunit B